MKLKQIRESRGLTQTELDDLASLRRGTVNDIERGKNMNPSWEVVRRISEALDENPEEVFPSNAA